MTQKIIELAGARIEHQGRVLLLHRIDKNHWELPGGKLKEKESHIQALKREVKEEIGVDVEIIERLGSVQFELNDKIYNSVQYSAVIMQGKPEIKEPELFDDLKFIDLDKEKNLSPNITKLK